jgi:hypothetical protein
VEQVVPQLRIMRHPLDELIKGRDRIGKKIIDLSSRVVHKTDHVEPDGYHAIGRFKDSAFHVFLVTFEKDARDKDPDDRGVPATLTGTVDWVSVAMLIRVFGNAHCGFEPELGFLEGRSVDKADISVLSMSAGCQGGNCRDNAIVA